MTHERVFTRARVHVPDPDAGVQTPGHNVHYIKLKKGNIHCSGHLEGFSQTVVIKSIQPQHSGRLQLIRIFIRYTASHLQTVDTVGVTR